MSLNYNGKNIVLAKNLRKNSTRQEKHLWYDFLAKYKARFQRKKQSTILLLIFIVIVLN